jgi:hypothetical protein
MKQFYLPLVLFFSLLISQFSWSQVKVGDNPTQISPFTVFELESTDKGFLPPRLTTTQRNGIDKQTAPLGLMIYNLDRNEVQYLNEEISIDATGKRLVVRTWESATSGASLTRPDAPEAGELYFDPDTGSLEVWNGSQWLSVSLGATTSSPTLLIDGSMLTIVGGNTVDLSTIIGQSGPRGGTGATGPAGPPGPAGPTGGDDQTLTLSGTTLSIQNGNSVDLTVFTNTDSQTITASLSGTILQLLPENTTVTETLDLAYFDNTGTDDQNLSFATSTSTTEGELVIESGNPVTLITSGTLSLVNINSSTLTLVSTATHGQLIQVNEGGNTGYRLLASNHLHHGDIGTNAVDLSVQTAVSTSTGARGNYSFASGRNSIASGHYSYASGRDAEASGDYSFASGRNSIVSGQYSFAGGLDTSATGNYSVAMGRASVASGTYSIALGNDTQALGFASMSWGGTSSTASGSYSTSWGGGQAIGDWSTAFGRTTEAAGNSSYARGLNTKASGNYSSAWGLSSTALGSVSTVWGWTATASGSTSTAGGAFTTAESFGQTSLGIYNTPHTGTPSETGIVPTDRLFVLGNGTGTTSRSDALVILKNGDTSINGDLTVSGTVQITNLPTGVATDVLVVADTSGNLRQLPITRAGTDTQTLSLTGDVLSISGTNSVSLDDFSQDITGSVFNSATNSLTIAISDGASQTLDLSQLDQDIADLNFDSATNSLTVGITNGTSSTVDLSALDNSGTDSQTLSLTGDVLSISGTNSVSLDDFSQDITGSVFNSATNSLTIAISDGASQTLDLSQLDQDIADLNFDSATNSLTVGITNGTSSTVDLSALDNSGTDSQTLSLTGDVLSISGTNSVSLDDFSQDITGSVFNSATNSLTIAISDGASQTLSLATLGSTTVSGTLTLRSGTSSYTLPNLKGATDQVLTMLDASSGTTTWTTPEDLTFIVSGTTVLSRVGTATHDFVFGATQFDNIVGTADDARFFFDKSKGAFRAGYASGTTWNNANIGDRSTAFGYNTEASGDRSTAWGEDTEASASNATAWGSDNIASGIRATAWGQFTQATANNATAWGENTEATGAYATAWGQNTTASGTLSTAWGALTTASGTLSTAWGAATTAESYGQTTLGLFNTAHPSGANASGYNPFTDQTDRLFVIGNGAENAGTIIRSDALVMLKNGNTTLNGALTINASYTTTSYTLPIGGGTNGQVLSMQDATTGTTTWTTLTGGGVAQNINGLNYNTATASLTVGISGGTSQEISLATLGSTTVSGTLTVNQATRLGSSTLLRNPGTYAAPGSPSAILGIEGATEARLRLIAGEEDGDSGTRAPNIDLYGNNASQDGGRIDFIAGNTTAHTVPSDGAAMRFYTYASTSSPRNQAMTLTSSGTLLIGKTTADTASRVYKLEVEGNALVNGELWGSGTASYTYPDYVFESYFEGVSSYNNNYSLPTLKEVESFVKTHKHLPGVQSREEVSSEGWNISKNIQSNLEKVEELYLHTIEQQKQLDAKDAEIKALKERLAKIEAALGIE